eukprot:1195061-Prorocentrum_minimum.AAC.8
MTSSTLILFQIRFSDSSGRGGIVVYGGEEPGSSPTAEPKQEPPTASAEGPAVPLGPIDGMPMPSVDVVEEEKDESLNTARRLFPDVELPDKPEKPCSAELQVEPPRMAKINKYLELKAQGRSINNELRKSKGYRNPDFLQKITTHFNIKELQSHFPKDVFDPEGYPAGDYFDKLGTIRFVTPQYQVVLSPPSLLKLQPREVPLSCTRPAATGAARSLPCVIQRHMLRTLAAQGEVEKNV